MKHTIGNEQPSDSNHTDKSTNQHGGREGYYYRPIHFYHTPWMPGVYFGRISPIYMMPCTIYVVCVIMPIRNNLYLDGYSSYSITTDANNNKNEEPAKPQQSWMGDDSNLSSCVGATLCFLMFMLLILTVYYVFTFPSNNNVGEMYHHRRPPPYVSTCYGCLD